MSVVILRGASGAGKSTFIKNHYAIKDGPNKGKFSAYISSADHFFTDRAGVYKYVPEKIGEAHGYCLRHFIESINYYKNDDHQLLLVDNTNILIHEIAPYVAVGLAYGHQVEIISLRVPVEVCLARATHGAPKDVIEWMCGQIETVPPHFPKWWDHRFVDGVVETPAVALVR